MNMYTLKDIQEISGDQLSPKYYGRSIQAFNGLKKIFGKEWIENEVSDKLTNDVAVKALGKDRMYKGIGEVEKLVFLWEDLQILNALPGFDEFTRKLKNGVRFENVDLEISIAADFIRCGAEIELEPRTGEGLRKADCRVQPTPGQPSFYVEITRKIRATTQITIDERGLELAKFVSMINPKRRCVLVVMKELSQEQYLRLVDWLKGLPIEGNFEDVAIFFSVEHNTDESRIALRHVNPPVSVRQATGDFFQGSFGVVYIHIPDYGAKKKLSEKVQQLPLKEQNLLVIDLTNIDGGVTDWEKQLTFERSTEHCSAVLLITNVYGLYGQTREVKLIANINSTNELSDSTKKFLDKFSLIRINKDLMH